MVDTRVADAYLGNTGRLRGVIEMGRTCYCTRNPAGAKTELRIIGVEDGDFSILVDTFIQERSFVVAHKLGALPWLKGCSLVKRNVKLGGAVLDFLFNCNGSPVYVELKSAVMKLPGGYAGYPDAPTARGRRQLEALTELVRLGARGVVVFVAGVPGVRGFKPYCLEDRAICRIMRRARLAGVQFRAISVYLNHATGEVVLENPDLPVELGDEFG